MSRSFKWTSPQRIFNSLNQLSPTTTFSTGFHPSKGKISFRICNCARSNPISTFSRRAKQPPCSSSSETVVLGSSSTIRKRKSRISQEGKVSGNLPSFILPHDPHQSNRWNIVSFFASLIKYSRRPCKRLLRKIINSQNHTLKKLLSSSIWPVKKKQISLITHTLWSLTKAMSYSKKEMMLIHFSSSLAGASNFKFLTKTQLSWKMGNHLGKTLSRRIK